MAVSLPVMERVRWAPGGDALLVSGMDGKGRAGLFYVDLAHGDAMRPIAAEAGLASKGFPGVFSRDGKTVYYIYNETEVRARGLAADSEERTLATGSKLRHLAIQADGGTLAFTQGDAAIVLQPLGAGPARTIPFDHPSELEWGQPGLWVGRGEELWRVPVDGSAPVRVTAAPRGRVPGFSLGPRGSLAVTVGTQDTQVWRLRLGGGGKP